MSNGIILFADNNSRFVKVRKEFLEQKGYRVIAANNPTEAKEILRKERVDLAILDIRMVDDTDERDISGLNLAKETARDMPKIILTGFPTWEAVREALGPDLNGVPPAADFISKEEGVEAMLRAVELTLRRPQLRTNLLQMFEVVTLMALPQRVVDLGPEEASSRFQKSFEATSRELTQYREQENRRAAQYHFWGLIAAVLGMLLVVVGAALVLLRYADPSAFPLIVSAISEAASLLFFRREDKAYKRVGAYFAQLNELNNLGNLLTICNGLQSPSDREKYKRKVIDKVIARWFGE
jgi:CheY-like chemotaxis protein